MGVQAAFVLLVVFVATAKTQDVTFWGKTVTLTCPEEGQWLDAKEVVVQNSTKTYTFEFKGQAQYQCRYGDEVPPVDYSFLVKGKACENCFELDGLVFMMVIILDVLGTAVLMMVIFKFTKKKSSDGPPPLPRSPGRPRGSAPSGHSSTYQSLNPKTLTVDTYSTVVNRTG